MKCSESESVIEKVNDINRENLKILNKLVEISKGKQVRSLGDSCSCSPCMVSSNWQRSAP
jgi:hypothetical protein